MFLQGLWNPPLPKGKRYLSIPQSSPACQSSPGKGLRLSPESEAVIQYCTLLHLWQFCTVLYFSVPYHTCTVLIGLWSAYCSLDCNKPGKCHFLFVHITSECFSCLLLPFMFHFFLPFYSHVSPALDYTVLIGLRSMRLWVSRPSRCGLCLLYQVK